jgi:hypothetical protein
LVDGLHDPAERRLNRISMLPSGRSVKGPALRPAF